MIRVVFLGEYLRAVKSKAFWATTLLMPLGVAVTLVALGAMRDDVDRVADMERVLEVVGGHAEALYALREALGEGFLPRTATTPVEAGKEAVRAGRLAALLVLPGHAGETIDTARLYVSRMAAWQVARLNAAVPAALRELRLATLDLPPAARAALEERVGLETVYLMREGDEPAGPDWPRFVGAGGALALMVMAMIYAGTVMQMVSEEKISRMAEIVVSSVRPSQLMFGKIVAAGALCFTQLLLWALLGALFAGIGFAVTSGVGAAVEARLGMEAATLAAASDAAPQPAEWLAGLSLPRLIGAAALAAVLLPIGFLLYASVFAALGAMFENPAEAQNMIFVGMLPMFGVVGLAIAAIGDPDGAAFAISAYYPFSSPAMLPARVLAGDLAAWRVASGVAILVATTAGVVWLAGRIFRGALLLYGKTPTLRDLRAIVLDS